MNRINTNTKEFKTKVQSEIVNDWEWTREKLQDQFNVFNWMQGGNYQKAMYLIEGGAFDCYYSQVADTMAKWFDCSTDEIWKYYKEDSSKMWDSYKHIMAINICNILEQKRCYI